MESAAETVRRVIRERKTEKILGDPDNPVEYSEDRLALADALVQAAIRDCGWAPFHYDRQTDGIAEPWRVHWLDKASCRNLGQALPDLIPDMKPGNKMPALLAACGSLALFSWVPHAEGSIADTRKLRQINQEHLAATAAAVQNLLLLLTAQGMSSYWASGTLISDCLFSQLGIPESYELAAAVFIHYPGGSGPCQALSGKQRERRSPDQSWFRQVAFPAPGMESSDTTQPAAS